MPFVSRPCKLAFAFPSCYLTFIQTGHGFFAFRFQFAFQVSFFSFLVNRAEIIAILSHFTNYYLLLYASSKARKNLSGNLSLQYFSIKDKLSIMDSSSLFNEHLFPKNSVIVDS